MTTAIRQALLVALVEHEDRDSLLGKLLGPANRADILRGMSGSTGALTRADVFVPLPGGKHLVESKKFWQNFDSVVEALNAVNDPFTADDFRRQVGSWPYRSVLMLAAEDHNALPKIFNATVWGNRETEMMSLWNSLQKTAQNQVDIMAVRREMAKRNGRKLREDDLSEAGITPDMIMKAMKDGEIDTMQAKLKAVGKRLSKADFFYVDNTGDTAFYYKTTWENFEKFVKIAAENGERFTAQDFLFARQQRPRSLLLQAGDHAKLSVIFKPEYWVKNIAEMESLWAQTADNHKAQVNFPELIAKVEDLSYGGDFVSSGRYVKADLTKPIAAAQADKRSIAPLDLLSVWSKIDTVQGVLNRANTPLTLDDLRGKSARDGASYLQVGIRFGKLDRVLAIAAGAGQQIEVADLVTTDKAGVRPLDDLARTNQLAGIFDANIWVGRVPDMQKLWGQVPEAAKGQVDYQKVLSEANAASLRALRNRPTGPKA